MRIYWTSIFTRCHIGNKKNKTNLQWNVDPDRDDNMIKVLLFVRIWKIGSVKIGQCLFAGNALLRFCQMRRKSELHFVVLQWCASWRIIMIRKYEIKCMYFRFVSWLIPKIDIHVLPWIVYANVHTILISKKRRTIDCTECRTLYWYALDN